jgi:hypothetical protein
MKSRLLTSLATAAGLCLAHAACAQNTTAAAPTPVPATPAPAAPAVAATTDTVNTARFFTGVLKMRTDPKIQGPINAKYLLEGSKGRLLALVDLSEIALPHPLVNYLGKTVKVYGYIHPTPDPPYAMITAKLLQLN